MNTIIDSVQKEEPKRASPVRVERAYIRIHKGPAESRSELCLSLAKTPRPLNVIHGTCDTASSYVIDFRCVLDFGEGQD